ncbi:TatD family hydrolase [Amphibiibacter pelophylacis]|uniref:TatD family hydrolase n=1 Tax=Amphibiibacter pelophylacis TaxID=1799477 RepID=A0ACC6P407_9BURK
MFTDSHCHLNFPDFADMSAVLAAMRAAQVDEALCISTLMETLPDVIRLAENHAPLWATVGVHPDNEGVTEPTVDDLCHWAQHPRVLGIGETGLDYYRLGERTVADMQWQRDRFAVHIEAAQRSGLPLIIHTRSASEDTVAMLREAQRAGPVTGVFHCFTETDTVARQALELGFYISLSGIVTFKNARDLQDVARWLPQDRLLIETDSPYLAPVPHRGKTNQPAFVSHVAAFLAELRGEALHDLASATTRNFRTLFAAKWRAQTH